MLGEIKEAFANVASIVIADYRGITVPVVTTMRDDFRKAGCHYRVIKNSLVKIAVKGSKMEPLTPAHGRHHRRHLVDRESRRRRPGRAEVGQGRAQVQDQGRLLRGPAPRRRRRRRRSRKMPGKNEIRASMLMTFLAAPQSFVAQLAAAPQNFAYLLDARKRELEAA